MNKELPDRIQLEFLMPDMMSINHFMNAFLSQLDELEIEFDVKMFETSSNPVHTLADYMHNALQYRYVTRIPNAVPMGHSIWVFCKTVPSYHQS